MIRIAEFKEMNVVMNDVMNDVITYVYSLYKAHESLVQTNGFFSLNLTKASVIKIMDLLDFGHDQKESCLWIGCGDAREVLCMAMLYPNVHFTAVDINESAIHVAQAKFELIGLKNINIEYKDALLISEGKYTHIYSTALAGVELYDHIVQLCPKTLCMLSSMWKHSNSSYSVEKKAQVSLSGSRERKTLICRS
jgi:cyclopropane fatty-acyl-phospholipid synthase-like methyltransferase